MIDDGEYEKKIVYINSENSKFISNTEYSFSFDLSEIIRDVVYIKILKTELGIQVNGIDNTILNGVAIKDGDPIYVNLNNYSRILTRINENTEKFFEIVNINMTEKFGNNVPNGSIISFKNNSGTQTFNPYNSDTHIMLSDNNITRFNISLYDKNNNILKQSEVPMFSMTLCLYALRKKCSQF